jgi:hypothetical protein
MNPSSSSNADAAGPVFKVASRALAADLSAARIEESSRDLESTDTAGLLALLGRLAALDPADFGDADPHLVVGGRRGRFAIRPAGGRLVVRTAGADDASYLVLEPAAIPAFLDGRDLPAASADLPDAGAPAAPASPRRALAGALFAAAGLAVAVSAWLTFRPVEIDPASAYIPIADATEADVLRRQTVGVFVTGPADDERFLEIHADGIVRYRETAPEGEPAADRSSPGTLARRRDLGTPVIRTDGLGTIDVTGADTLVYARETYVRRPPATPSRP